MESSNHELLVDLLREVNRGLGEQLRGVFSKYDLPGATMFVASQIRRKPGVTISELARITNIAKSHISNIVQQLCQKGWVEKRNDASDHRIIRLYLTSSATEQLSLVREDIRNHVFALVSSIPEKQTGELIEGLTLIKAGLSELREKHIE